MSRSSAARVAVLSVKRYKYLDQKLHRRSYFRDSEVIANRSHVQTRVSSTFFLYPLIRFVTMAKPYFCFVDLSPMGLRTISEAGHVFLTWNPKNTSMLCLSTRPPYITIRQTIGCVLYSSTLFFNPDPFLNHKQDNLNSSRNIFIFEKHVHTSLLAILKHKETIYAHCHWLLFEIWLKRKNIQTQKKRFVEQKERPA